MTTTLASISPAGWVCIFVGSWLILACVGSAGLCAVACCLKRKPKPEPVRATYPPPVPPSWSAEAIAEFEADAMWLADQPTDVWLTAELASRKCREIFAIEGLS